MKKVNPEKMFKQYLKELDVCLARYFSDNGITPDENVNHPLSIKDRQLYCMVDFLKFQICQLAQAQCYQAQINEKLNEKLIELDHFQTIVTKMLDPFKETNIRETFH